VKVLVKDIKLAMTQVGGAMRLVGEKYNLDMFSLAPDAFFAMATVIGKEQSCGKCGEQCENCQHEKDDRLGLAEIIKILGTNAKVEELYINGTKESAFIAELKINGETKRVVPSIGVLVAKIFGAPIYFESDLAKKENTLAA